MLQDRPADARALMQESLSIYAELELKIAIAYCLEVLAGMDTVTDAPARLFGAADRLREEIAAPVESFNLERYEHDLNQVRERLGETDFLAAFEAGNGMTLADAVKLAMAPAGGEPVAVET